MPDLSGATSVGGVIIPIGLDLAQLQGDAGKARQILDQLDKGGAGGGQGAKPIPIKFASVQETTQEFTKTLRPLQPVAEQEGEKIGKKLAEGIEKGHEGHSKLARKNLLSARGLEGLGVGGSATSAFAIIEAMKIAGDIAEAQQITGARILAKAAPVGSGYTPDAGARYAAGQLAESQRTEKVLGAFEGLPIIGSLLKLGTAGIHADMSDEQLVHERSMQSSQQIHETGVQHAVEWAEFQGDKAGAQRLTREESLKKEQGLLKNQQAEYHKWLQKHGTDSTPEQRQAAWERIVGPASDAVEQHRIQNARMNDRAEDVQKAGRAEVVASGEAAKIRGGAIGTDSLNQLKENQRAAKVIFNAQTQKIFSQTPTPKLYETMESRRQEEAEQEKKDSEAVKQKIIEDRLQISEAVTKGDAAQLQSHHQLYAAEMALAKEADENEIERMRARHDSPEKIQATIDRQRKVAEAKREEHEEAVRNDTASSIVGTQAANLRAQRRNHEAEVLERNESQRQILEKMDHGDRDTESGRAAINARRQKAEEFEAQNRAADIAYVRQLSQTGAQIQARTDAAIYEQHDEPLAAQMRQAALAAKQAVENADPTQVEAVRNEQHQILEAKRHQLFDPHSGGYAAMGSSYFLPGDPFRSSKDAQDRADAARELQKGQEGIDAASKGIPGNVATLVDLMRELLQEATGFVKD